MALFYLISLLSNEVTVGGFTVLFYFKNLTLFTHCLRHIFHIPVVTLISMRAESLKVKVWVFPYITGKKRTQPVGKRGTDSPHAFVLNVKNIHELISKCHLVIVLEPAAGRQFSDSVLFKVSV